MSFTVHFFRVGRPRRLLNRRSSQSTSENFRGPKGRPLSLAGLTSASAPAGALWPTFAAPWPQLPFPAGILFVMLASCMRRCYDTKTTSDTARTTESSAETSTTGRNPADAHVEIASCLTYLEPKVERYCCGHPSGLVCTTSCVYAIWHWLKYVRSDSTSCNCASSLFYVATPANRSPVVAPCRGVRPRPWILHTSTRTHTVTKSTAAVSVWLRHHFCPRSTCDHGVDSSEVSCEAASTDDPWTSPKRPVTSPPCAALSCAIRSYL